MLPLFKLVSLCIRLFSRPLVNQAKLALKGANPHPRLRKVLIYFGQTYHRLTIRLQRQFMKLSNNDSYIKPLQDEKAIEQGAEFLGEIVVYGTLLTWGIYEAVKLSKDAKKKRMEDARVITDIHARIDGVQQQYAELEVQLLQVHSKLDSITTLINNKNTIQD